MCQNGGNSLGSLNATAFADLMRLFFARNVYTAVSASSDQSNFALLARGLGTCAQRVAPANISAYAGVLDIFLNVLQFLASSTDWSLSTRPIVDLLASLRVLQLVPTKQCKPDEAGRARWRTYLTSFLRATLLSRMQAMQCFEQFSLDVGGEASIFLYKVCGVAGEAQSVVGQVEWDLANDTTIPDSGAWWLSFKTMPNPVLWDCSTRTRSLIHRGLFLDAAGNELKFAGDYTLYLATPGNVTTAKPMCTFWDEATNVYSTNGCQYIASVAGQYLCKCSHLTDFMVLTTSSDSSTGKLSNGAIAGIALGAVAAVSVVVVLIGYFAFYKRGACYKREKSHSFR